MKSLTSVATAEAPHADLANRAEAIERRAAEIEQQTQQHAVQVRHAEIQQYEARRVERARMLRTISDARHLHEDQNRKLWTRRGIVFAGAFVIGLILAADKRPKAKLHVPENRPHFNGRQLRWLARKLRTRR